eukprot:2906110-Amphidinium_carterae.2
MDAVKNILNSILLEVKTMKGALHILDLELGKTTQRRVGVQHFRFDFPADMTRQRPECTCMTVAASTPSRDPEPQCKSL